MSRQQHDGEQSVRSRQRANTASFPSLAWRRQRQEQPSTVASLAPPIVTQPVLALEQLIDALSPPAVPSLAHARSLAATLAHQSPLPRRALLNPILASLCDTHSPIAVQAAGYDILSSYWENGEATSLDTADRLSYFSLFLGPAIPWTLELWEPRFKALRALTRQGHDIVGLETPLLGLLKSWIAGGFEGLLRFNTTMERGERAERERSIDVIAAFLTSIVENPEAIARLSEEELAGVLQFYATLVDRSVLIPNESSILGRQISPPSESSSDHNTPLRSPHQTHRRNPSSLSIASAASPSAPSLVPTATKHPAELTIALYLNHLNSQLKLLPPKYLHSILPLLFRALAFCASPLPRLTVIPKSPKTASTEERVAEILNSLFAGPYSASCMLILKKCLFPPPNPQDGLEMASLHSSVTSQGNAASSAPAALEHTKTWIRTTFGAHRTLRNYVRRALSTRLARAYISRESAVGYSHSGAPGHLDVERDLMERAWPKDEYITASPLGMGGNGWDAGRLGAVLTKSVEAWIVWSWESTGDVISIGGNGSIAEYDATLVKDMMREYAESILDEAAGILKDVLQELDAREDGFGGLDDEEAAVVGETLLKLSEYLKTQQRSESTPYVLPLLRPSTAPTPFLRTLATLLGRDHNTNLNPLLSTTLMTISDHLTDADTARVSHTMYEQQDLSPTSPDWLDNWQLLLQIPSLVDSRHPLTRSSILQNVERVYESVRDMADYRVRLADLVFDFCSRWSNITDAIGGDSVEVWKILGSEVVQRSIEGNEGMSEDNIPLSSYVALLESVGLNAAGGGEQRSADVSPAEPHSASPQTPFATPSSMVSPMFSRMQSDFQGQGKEKDTSLPSVMSIISSLTTGNSSRSQSMQPQGEDPLDESPSPLPPPDASYQPRAVSAVSALVDIFSQLAFTPFIAVESRLRLVIKVYYILVTILSESHSPEARIASLQFLMRLRADRDHKIYWPDADYDVDGQILLLSSVINRVREGPRSQYAERIAEEMADVIPDIRVARSRYPQNKEGPSQPVASRSQSRPPGKTSQVQTKIRPALWQLPEQPPFTIIGADSPSETLFTYDPDSADATLVLPISRYLLTILAIIESEQDWEVLSYVLCHLPVQLANKHLFCGGKCRSAISKILSALAPVVHSETFGRETGKALDPAKVRDAQGLAYHTLSVLISYARCFDLKQRHFLVETFYMGLNGQQHTIKCCLHALSLAAFELQSSMIRCLPRIMERLSQIMSNPHMAVHILGFLSITGSLPSLYANFTDADFKVIFAVALQYLQHYNRSNASPTISWALSQHVRILSYYLVYVWFLAVRLSDRPGHIPYITRQLLLANEGNDQVDGATEVCFDWLARYAYASADPRPANSLFSDIIMNPSDVNPEVSTSEKTWLLGSSVVTIRALARVGWIEVLTRRPSGFSRFLCHVENAPLVGPGDVAPDMLTIPAALLIDRELPKAASPDAEDRGSSSTESLSSVVVPDSADAADKPERPDSVTGYVWSGSAPSQRRKRVDVDPSYMALQMSSYPDSHVTNARLISNTSMLPRFFASLDRIPVIDTHKVGILYVAPGQTNEVEILRNTHGSPAYTRFLEGVGRLINLRGQLDVYAGGLDPDEDGQYSYAWWDDIGQILYHTATMMPNSPDDPLSNQKKRHIGNDYVRIVWNDSGKPYRFDTLSTEFQFVNIVIEPHSLGAIAAFSNNLHENEYFKVTVQRAPGMPEFAPVGQFKLISAVNLPLLVRQLSLLADWFASVFAHTQRDTVRIEMKTNWHNRLETIIRFRNQQSTSESTEPVDGILGQERLRDFTINF